MMEGMHSLDNPIWHALSTSQAHLAEGGPHAKRYAAEVAPFLAVPDAGQGAEALAALVTPGEVLTLIGVIPPLPSHWQVEQEAGLLQMTATRPVAVTRPDPDFTVLTVADAPDMLALTALVFPGYFRPRTIEMGVYLGIRVEGRLVAMAGERMALPGHREISGVCTHPDYLGRGYAGSLVGHLLNAQFDRGESPFLHVNPNNAGAIRLYEKLGFIPRAELPLCQIRCLN
jgi:ribosomal protein S18 acetylase RimI-like enzyme